MKSCLRRWALVALSLWPVTSVAAEWDLQPTPIPHEVAPTPAAGETYLSEPAADDLAWEATSYASSRWTIWAGAIFLERNSPQVQPLLRSSVNGNPFLYGDDFNFSTGAGVDLNALRHGEVFDVDFRYFQVNGMSANDSVNPFSPFLPPFPGPPFSAPTIDALATTQIQSVELNLRKNVSPRIALLAGFRYFALDDTLRHQFDVPFDGFSLFKIDVDAVNRLYGGQIGADAIIFSRGRFQVESAVKAGVYGNEARNRLAVSVLESPTVTVGSRADHTAFVGDWNFNGVYQITDHWAIRAGYQLLWVSGVALSPDQFDILYYGTSPSLDVKTSGDLFLHGAIVGLQANW